MLQSKDPTEAQSAALSTVLQITDVVSQAKDASDLCERALDAIVAYTRFPCCGIFQLDASGTTAHLVAHRNVSPAVYERARSLPVEGSLTGHAIKLRRVVTSADIGGDERVEPNTRRALTREGLTEVASIPLIYRERALGTINLIYRAGEGIAQTERDILLGIGQTIAIALANRIAEDEQLKLQEHVRKAEQVERMGLLAGGIAHDFNNFLTSVLGNISLAKELLATGCDSEEVRHLLEGAEKGSERAAALVQQLLTFSKGGAPVLESTARLGALVRESAEFSVHGSSVRLEFDIAADLKPVEIDPAQISRMVQNLVLNAVQASQAGGSVSVELKNVSVEERDFVQIGIADRGHGITPADLAQIFDPYFTTKVNGSGLGLPTVRSIVDAHGGSIEVETSMGVGSRFLVRLPTTSRVPVEEQRPSHRLGQPATRGRVLVLDDEAAIRNLAQRILERDGYEVVTVSDGEEAVRTCAHAIAEERPFVLAILDLTIVGGVGGREAMPRIRALIPNIAAVVCSGYSEDAAMSQHLRHGFDAVLPKPYTLEQFEFATRRARSARLNTIQ